MKPSMIAKIQTLHVDVTREDIDAGHPCNAGECPVARAANRALRKALNTSRYYVYVVDAISVYIRDTHIRAAYYSLPMCARNFINAFDLRPDLRHELQPFSFTCEML